MNKFYKNLIIILTITITNFSFCLKKPTSLEWLSAQELTRLGLYFRREGNYPMALKYFQFASLRSPLNFNSKFEVATAYLGCKKLKKGFARLHDFLVHRIPFKNIWQGQSLLHKSILVFVPYWGAGDFFMFARYISLLKEYTPQNIIIYCHMQLTKIMQQLFPDLEIKTYDFPNVTCDNLSESYPNLSECYQTNYSPIEIILENVPNTDYQIHLFSLPFIFETTKKNIPHKLFDLASVSLKQFWKKQFERDKKFKVGIYWQGAQRNDPQLASRAIPLLLLNPILRNTQCSFYSLQHGNGIEQLANIDSQISVTWFNNIDTYNGSFVDTAAIIQNLDLVITIDTSIAHLASILGKKVWLMLPFSADWRYQLDNTTCPWYPNMRVFKQPIQGDWQTVINNIQHELMELVK